VLVEKLPHRLTVPARGPCETGARVFQEPQIPAPVPRPGAARGQALGWGLLALLGLRPLGALVLRTHCAGLQPPG
jgi:hypothetical protein